MNSSLGQPLLSTFKEGCQWRPLESSDVGDMMCACVQLDPSAHAVPLVGAVVFTLTTKNTRSATLETSISATGDSSTLVFASTTSAEVEIDFVGSVFLLIKPSCASTW